VTGEQNGPVRSGRTPRVTFGKRDRAVERTVEPQESTFGLISVISVIAVALVILVAGSLVVSSIVGNANGGTQQQPAAYCVDQYGNPAPPGACR
jgi:hypothetical protein